MSKAYEEWFAKEEEWIGERYKKEVGKLFKFYLPICFVSIEGILGLIGFFVGEEEKVEAILRNLFMGLIFFLIFAVIIILAICSGGMKRRYIKVLNKEVAKRLPSDSQKELFAREMLGMDGEYPRTVEWTESKAPITFYRTEHFAMKKEMNVVEIVETDLVERIEIDAKTSDNYIHTSSVRIHTTSEYFPIYYYYKKQEEEISGKKKKTGPDVIMHFNQRDNRDQAVELLKQYDNNAEESMQKVDKEAERKEYEKSPKGKLKKALSIIGWIIAFVALIFIKAWRRI